MFVRVHSYIHGRKHALIHAPCVFKTKPIVLRDENVNKNQEARKSFFLEMDRRTASPFFFGVSIIEYCTLNSRLQEDYL